MSGTKVRWISREGREMEHNFGYPCTLTYARDWYRRSILESQPTAFMTVDEKRASKLRLVAIENT